MIEESRKERRKRVMRSLGWCVYVDMRCTVHLSCSCTVRWTQQLYALFVVHCKGTWCTVGALHACTACPRTESLCWKEAEFLKNLTIFNTEIYAWHISVPEQLQIAKHFRHSNVNFRPTAARAVPVARIEGRRPPRLLCRIRKVVGARVLASQLCAECEWRTCVWSEPLLTGTSCSYER